MSKTEKNVIKYDFEEVRIHRIEEVVHPENIASNKLNMKLGFKKEGFKESSAYNRRTNEFEDRLIYGIINNI
ncbi:hypothetical protein C3495_09110 [Clostridiaceae bacterium 14S0207]|nr:hypothetical protein C3495_09110 [Clostridiaceae bacterium 14S0207]